MQVSWVVELSKDYAAKRDQLKRPSGAVKDGLVSDELLQCTGWSKKSEATTFEGSDLCMPTSLKCPNKFK